MGWFGADKKENVSESLTLPELPELPSISEDFNEGELHQLPVLPSTNFGERFSQNRIKEAITKEKDEDDFDLPELPKERVLVPRPLEDAPAPEKIVSSEKISKFTKESDSPKEIFEDRREYIEKGKFSSQKSKKQDPVFVRIDKYQESLEVFEKTRAKLAEVEELFKRNKLIKEEEERQIEEWERQIQEIKEHIQKIDKEMFSKIE